MVTPGQMLVTLFDPKRMQLVASVRESLTRNLQVGQNIGVRIDGLNKQCSGTVSEESCPKPSRPAATSK